MIKVGGLLQGLAVCVDANPDYKGKKMEGYDGIQRNNGCKRMNEVNVKCSCAHHVITYITQMTQTGLHAMCKASPSRHLMITIDGN